MENLTTSQLKSELKKVGLKVSGKKADLIQRLTEYQNSQKNTSSETKKQTKSKRQPKKQTKKEEPVVETKKEEPVIETKKEEVEEKTEEPRVRPSCKDIFYKNQLEELDKRIANLQNIPEKLSLLNQKLQIIVSLFDNKREIDNWNIGEIIRILNSLTEKNNYLLKKDGQITELLNKIVKTEDKE
jgi:hypothetical protein